MAPRRHEHILVGLMVAAVLAVLTAPLLSVARAPRRARWSPVPREERVASAEEFAIEGDDSEEDEGSSPMAVGHLARPALATTADRPRKGSLRAHNGMLSRLGHVETVVRRE